MLLIDRGCHSISQQGIARCAGGVPMEIAILAFALNHLFCEIMNVTLLTIDLTTEANTWTVGLQVGETVEQFQIVRESVLIGDRQGWAFNAEPRFYDRFQFNQQITHEVFRVLRQMVQGESIALPKLMGRFYSPREAQAEMLDRRGEKLEVVGISGTKPKCA